MEIKFYCSSCQAKLQVEAEPGAKFQCPTCGASIVLPKDSLPPGTIVGGFRIENLLGHGGMGDVYLARQISLDRQVALKILSPQVSHDKEDAQGFLNEMRLLAKLEHPNIVTAYEAGEQSGMLYLAMAYVRGESLMSRLRSGTPLPERDALLIVRKLASALAYAWNEHRLLHRDINPANILLDAAGEPKLADLGVARSMKEGAGAFAGMVTGTPNYMSPEQVEARSQPDARSDMYSLGSTLWHMVTGKPPFEGLPVEEVLKQQVSEPLPNPREFNPRLSSGCVELIQTMVAKDPAQRHQTWEELIADVRRVMTGKHPSRMPEAADAARKIKIDHRALEEAHAARPGTRRPLIPLLVGIAALAALAVIGYEGVHQSRLLKLKQEYAQALQYAQQNPDDYAGAVQRLELVRQKAHDTPLEITASGEIIRMRELRETAARRAWSKLKAEAQQFVAQGQYEQALQLLNKPGGPFADDMAAAAADMAAGITLAMQDAQDEAKRTAADQAAKRRAQQQAEEAKRAAQKAAAMKPAPEPPKAATETPPAVAAGPGPALEALRDKVASLVLREQFTDAIAAVQNARKEDIPADELNALLEQIKQVDIPAVIMASFQKDIGKTVSVTLASGVEELEIRSATADSVEARRGNGQAYVNRTFSLRDLTAEEVYRRLGEDARPAVSIMQGLLAYQLRKPTTARDLFQKAGPGLGLDLSKCLDRMLAATREDAAVAAYQDLLRKAGLSNGGTSSDDLLDRIKAAHYTPADMTRIRAEEIKFRQEYGETEIARKAESALNALDAATTAPGEAKAAVASADTERTDGTATNAQAMVDQAIEALRKANPNARRLRYSTGELDGGITLRLSSNQGMDDIRPLANLPLVGLDISGSAVDDISALRNMPLKELRMDWCRVQDIGPLKGLPLEVLHMSHNPVQNLAPLKGMPLRSLHAGACLIKDIRPIQGMPLESLNIERCPIGDISVLMSILKNMPVRDLAVSGVGDLRMLQGMSLTSLYVEGSFKDLHPLAEMPLKSLEINSPNVKDLKGIETLSLESLTLRSQDLNDISAIRGIPLKRLYLCTSSVSDIGVLKDMSVLSSLDLTGTRSPDVGVLMDCPALEELAIPMQAKNVLSLHDHPRLQRIGYSMFSLQPADWFFKSVEGRKR